MKKFVLLLLGSVVLSLSPTVSAHQFLNFSAVAYKELPRSENLSAAQGRNGIYVTVFGTSRTPVSDTVVELLDDLNRLFSRGRTDAAGRVSFLGLENGRYKVKVLPYSTEYLEETQEVVLSSVSATAGSGSDRQQVDIYLRPGERIVTGPFAAAPGTVFAQEIPKAARKAYEEGLNFLREKKESEGLASLRQAIELFPSYYLALDRLGGEYAIRGTANRSYLEAALVLLAKALEINPRSPSAAFGLGWTQYHLGRNAEAIETLRKAVNLNPKAVDCYLWLGKALKQGGNIAEAETVFKKANDLADKKSSEAHWQLAKIYSDQKRYQEAADELEMFLKVQPNAADAERIRVIIKQLRDKAALPAK